MITILIVDDKTGAKGNPLSVKEGGRRIPDPRSNEWKGCTGSIRIKPCGYFIFGCKDALYEWTGADESSERRSSGYGNRDLQRI